MAPNDEPKMDELKRLLRRLDGLEARRASAAGTSEADQEQRDYVGTLRGAPELDENAHPITAPAERNVSAKSAAILAAVIAGLISTATVYVLMSAEPRVTAPAEIRPLGTSPAGTASPAGKSEDTSMAIVRSAAALMQKGDVESARELLRRAAELGSGPAALELARTYEDAALAPSSPQPSDTNSALARAWYDRARELGMTPEKSPPPPPAR